MSDGCMVFFPSGACSLDDAVRALTDYGLTVVPQSDHLLISRPGSPLFRVRLSMAEWVRIEAAEIGGGTPYAAAMRDCDARFEIDFDSLDEALQEINTLMEVQVALQDACQGFLFLSWNGSLSEPWSG